MYECNIFNLTDRTRVYQVTDSAGRPVAQFPINKPRAAHSFARMLIGKKIRTLADWNQLPGHVHFMFVCATSTDAPCFHEF